MPESLPEYQLEEIKDAKNRYRLKLGHAVICEIAQSTWGSPRYWYVSQNTLTMAQNLQFPSCELARDFMTAVHQSVGHHIATHPLPPEVADHLRACASGLRERHGHLMVEMYNVLGERHRLLRLCSRFGADPALMYLDDCDVGAAVQNLLDFKRDGQDMPFLSEAVLYELLGKDDARTLLSLFRGLVKLVAPDKEVHL